MQIPAVFPGLRPRDFPQCCHADPRLPSGPIGEVLRQTERKIYIYVYFQAHKHAVSFTSPETGADSSSIPVRSVTQPGLVNKTGGNCRTGNWIGGCWGFRVVKKGGEGAVAVETGRFKPGLKCELEGHRQKRNANSRHIVRRMVACVLPPRSPYPLAPLRESHRSPRHPTHLSHRPASVQPVQACAQLCV